MDKLYERDRDYYTYIKEAAITSRLHRSSNLHLLGVLFFGAVVSV